MSAFGATTSVASAGASGLSPSGDFESRTICVSAASAVVLLRVSVTVALAIAALVTGVVLKPGAAAKLGVVPEWPGGTCYSVADKIGMSICNEFMAICAAIIGVIENEASVRVVSSEGYSMYLSVVVTMKVAFDVLIVYDAIEIVGCGTIGMSGSVCSVAGSFCRSDVGLSVD